MPAARISPRSVSTCRPSTCPRPTRSTRCTTGGASYERLATGGRPGEADSLVYQRLWNPNVDRFERSVAQLEGGDGAVAFATGMAALAAVLSASVAAGRPHVVGVPPALRRHRPRAGLGLLGTRVTWATPDRVAEAIAADTGLVLVETPANPTVDLVDLAAVVAQAGEVPVVVDNTFATPVLQRPLTHGAGLVLHSATKFIGGPRGRHGRCRGRHEDVADQAPPGPGAHRRSAAPAGGLRAAPRPADAAGPGARAAGVRRGARRAAGRAPGGGRGPLPGAEGVRPGRSGRDPDVRPGQPARVRARRRVRGGGAVAGSGAA